MSDELLPCPWCGEVPVSFPSGDGTGVMIECMSYKCAVRPHTSWYGTDVAVRAWNRRISPQLPAEPAQTSIDALIKAARDEVREACANLVDRMVREARSDGEGTIAVWLEDAAVGIRALSAFTPKPTE